MPTAKALHGSKKSSTPAADTPRLFGVIVFEVLRSAGTLMILLGATLGITAFVARLIRPRAPRLPDFSPNTSVRLVGPGGAYRCHLLAIDARGIVLSAPLQRDHYVPLRVGDSLTVQIPSGDGIITFRTHILHRDPATHEYILAQPSRFRYAERRTEPRDHGVEGRRVSMNGNLSELRDISANGARIVTAENLHKGDEVEINFGRGEQPIRGWTLDSGPSVMDARPARVVRVRFEAPLSGLSSAEL